MGVPVSGVLKTKGSSQGINTSSFVLAALQESMQHGDDDAVRLIVNGCRQVCPDASDEEIVHFIKQHGPRFRQMKMVDNPMGLLIHHLPKCFQGESFAQYRRAEQQRREAAAAEEHRFRAEQQAILDNPNSNDEEKEWARQMLGLEKT
jgi:hypothetical protein